MPSYRSTTPQFETFEIVDAESKEHAADLMRLSIRLIADEEYEKLAEALKSVKQERILDREKFCEGVEHRLRRAFIDQLSEVTTLGK